jgi:ketosteroid isomerase-like protein
LTGLFPANVEVAVLDSPDPPQPGRIGDEMPDRLQTAREVYEAYVSGDRDVVERALAGDFAFYSPPDPGIDRAAYFERCWPNSELVESFEFVRLVEVGDEVIVTYESTKTDGSRFRNTEVLTFDGDKIAKAEVYFGWNL